MAKHKHSIWEAAPALHDYRAAEAYLSLLFNRSKVKELVKKLHAARTIEHQAKDLLRASQTHLLEKGNPHVARSLKDLKKRKKLSPVLLIQGDAGRNVALTIADGHHRICASWYLDEDVPVACCVVQDRVKNSRT